MHCAAGAVRGVSVPALPGQGRLVDAHQQRGILVDNWQKSFLDKLNKVQSQWVRSFEETIEKAVSPVFDDLSAFVRDNGFRVSTPLHDEGRRSFKFELSENAYLLLIMRFTGVGEFELRSECFVPGNEPRLEKSIVRLSDVDNDWADKQFRSALDEFIDQLSGSKFSAERNAQPVSV